MSFRFHIQEFLVHTGLCEEWFYMLHCTVFYILLALVDRGAATGARERSGPCGAGHTARLYVVAVFSEKIHY